MTPSARAMVVRRRMEFKRSCTFSFYVLLFRKHAIGSTGGERGVGVDGVSTGQSAGPSVGSASGGETRKAPTSDGKRTTSRSRLRARPSASRASRNDAERSWDVPSPRRAGSRRHDARRVRHATQITARDRCGIFASAVFKTDGFCATVDAGNGAASPPRASSRPRAPVEHAP